MLLNRLALYLIIRFPIQVKSLIYTNLCHWTCKLFSVIINSVHSSGNKNSCSDPCCISPAKYGTIQQYWFQTLGVAFAVAPLMADRFTQPVFSPCLVFPAHGDVDNTSSLPFHSFSLHGFRQLEESPFGTHIAHCQIPSTLIIRWVQRSWLWGLCRIPSCQRSQECGEIRGILPFPSGEFPVWIASKTGYNVSILIVLCPGLLLDCWLSLYHHVIFPWLRLSFC